MVGVGASPPSTGWTTKAVLTGGGSGRWAAVGQPGMWVKVLRGILLTGLGQTEVSCCDS